MEPINYKTYKNGKILLKIGTKTIGMIWVNDKKEPSEYISHFHIIEQFRNQGYGSLLMTDVIKRMAGNEAVSLHVGVSNEGAIRFYRKHGFFIACTTTNASKDMLTNKTERHYLMVKKLKQ